MQRNALLIQHCYIPYGTTQLEKTIKKRQKGPVWPPKDPFWGPLRYSEGNGLPEGANIRSKCVVNMSPTQADQSGAVGTKFGLPGPSEGPKRAILGQNGPF